MLKENISQIRKEFEEKIKSTNKLFEVQEITVEFLGKKGKVTALLKEMGNITAEERPVYGQYLNELRNFIEEKLDEKKRYFEKIELEEKLKKEVIDITLPGKKNENGTLHPITQVINKVTDIFLGMGYSIAEGPEIELTKYNFDALNTPIDHPARDIQDTFYIAENLILRTQTSPVQVRTMEKSEPPIKIICPGKVYRSDNIDATHSAMFHQIEGLVVDKNISFADLKGTLETFAKAMFGDKTKIRLRPHHFPFTEPSAEVDVSCFICNGSGCKVCKGEGWIEILGAGMVHPNVLKAGGIDSEKYSGFAFGMGVERIAMCEYGIDDLRYFYENDIRFLKQFK